MYADLLIMSVGWNVVLLLIVGWAVVKYRKIKKRLKDNPSFEANEMLADILKGNALVRIERIAPENIFLRRG